MKKIEIIVKIDGVEHSVYITDPEGLETVVGLQNNLFLIIGDRPIIKVK